MKQSLRINLIRSLVLHVGLIAVIAIAAYASSQDADSGLNLSIPVYTVTLVQQQSLPTVKHIGLLHDVKASEASQPIKHMSQDGSYLGKSSSLMKYLHHYVAQYQHYPRLAQNARQEGVVTVQFVLQTNGQITRLHVVNPSRFERLNKAAIRALQEASPIPDLQKYHLEKPMQLSLSLDYRLSA